MKYDACEPTPLSQRIAFHMALAVFIGIVGWLVVRVYFALVGDPDSDRKFVLNPNVLLMFPVIILMWVISLMTVVTSIIQSRRITKYAIGAGILLTAPAMPVVYWTARTYWAFFSEP